MELQYDGAGLHGWAKQDGLFTVEGSLESAFTTILGTVPVMRVAGRTDAGVHARRQVVSLMLPVGADVDRLQTSLNALTPPGVAVVRIVPAPVGFDARKDANFRTYRYYLSNSMVVSPFWRGYCWHVPEDIDLAAMRTAAKMTVGRHDFTAFTPTETEHVFFNRLVVGCAWKPARDGLAAVVSGRGSRTKCASAAGPGVGRRHSPNSGVGMLYLEVEAEAFLRHMVRTLVGTMVEVGLGRRDLEDFRGLLAGAPRQAAGPTAPAQGLFFWDVKYGRDSAAPLQSDSAAPLQSDSAARLE